MKLFWAIPFFFFMHFTPPTIPLQSNCDQLKKENDSLRSKLFLANYKVEKVRFYLNLTIKNPSQTKFLKGWVKRAIQ